MENFKYSDKNCFVFFVVVFSVFLTTYMTTSNYAVECRLIAGIHGGGGAVSSPVYEELSQRGGQGMACDEEQLLFN